MVWLIGPKLRLAIGMATTALAAGLLSAAPILFPASGGRGVIWESFVFAVLVVVAFAALCSVLFDLAVPVYAKVPVRDDDLPYSHRDPDRP
ncbi:hypothetical protein GCM10007860_21540 [Chitiniphilus shinanonensis]|uniref:Uncharacterized protein n=1 Tax=Chitiniphilus shinanonensis TaxID=553088 RepID=A0ABQ6BZ70_9NEIS|nr:hypothetical protein [Chitiniphilus shinanonensis]GLS05004.1 hypothetical protein GCM10007860_21540 [Chitiniphilus shinanonensis]